MKLAERMKVCVSTRRLLLLCCCFIMSTGQKVCDYNVPEGSSYTLLLGYEGFTIDHQLRWKHDEAILVRRKNRRYSSGKAEDIDDDGSLKLTYLQKTSSGNYTAEMWTSEGAVVKKPKSSWILCVTDKIPKPSVTIACENKTVTLTCNVSQSQGLFFKWSDNEKDVVNENKMTLTRPEDQLDTGSRYTCTVSKLGASETSSPAPSRCPNKEQTTNNHNHLFGLPLWTMVGILASGGALLLTLMLITVCCCSRARRREGRMLIEEQELRLAWSAPQQQHHHPQKHQHHQQPAGHTGPRQQLSKPAQEPERTGGVVDPDAPKLPKLRGGGGDPSVPKLPKPRRGGGDPSVPKPRAGDPSAPKPPKTRGRRDPSAPKLPKPRGGDPSAPKLPGPPGGDLCVLKPPSAQASSRLPTAEVTNPCSVDQGAPLGPRPANAPLGPRAANAPLGPRPANAPLGPRPANAPLGPRPVNAPLGPRPANAPLGPRAAAVDEEQPPPLPQTRKKVPRNQRGGADPYAGLR